MLTLFKTNFLPFSANIIEKAARILGTDKDNGQAGEKMYVQVVLVL